MYTTPYIPDLFVTCVWCVHVRVRVRAVSVFRSVFVCLWRLVCVCVLCVNVYAVLKHHPAC